MLKSFNNRKNIHFNRYLELVHPFWHKTHFKKQWIYINFVFCWMFGIVLNLSFLIPTSKVKYLAHMSHSLLSSFRLCIERFL